MTPRSQELTAGDDATVYQAGGNIINNGMTYDQVRQVALDVYYANAPELRELAKEVANARAEYITTDFLTRLVAKDPGALKNLADPDVQSVMFEAQKSYARSGEEDLEAVLVDLLVDRTTTVDRSLRNLVLNEAITSVPKLTEAQRRSIALVFLLRFTRTTSSTVDDFMSTYVDELVAVGGDIPSLQHDALHIEYVGAGSRSLGEYSFGDALMLGSEGLFTRGFSIEAVPTYIRESPHFAALFVPCPRQEGYYQLAGAGDDDVKQTVNALGVAEFLDELMRLSKHGRMASSEVIREATAHNPRLESVAKSWEQLKSLTLTTVGLVIGHSYWKRITGASEELDNWLMPD